MNSDKLPFHKRYFQVDGRQGTMVERGSGLWATVWLLHKPSDSLVPWSGLKIILQVHIQK